jgi:hypothetical protein
VLVAVLITYLAPYFFPSPPLAFYVARGWLGVMFAVALWRRWWITAPAMLVAATFEGSTAVCGALYAGGPRLAFEGLCDKGTGLPLTLPVLTGAVLAALLTIRGSTDKQGK